MDKTYADTVRLLLAEAPTTKDVITVLSAELFQTTKQNVSLHAKNIFADNELAPEATVKESLTVASGWSAGQAEGTPFRL